jgi:hypothetical protein
MGEGHEAMNLTFANPKNENGLGRNAVKRMQICIPCSSCRYRAKAGNVASRAGQQYSATVVGGRSVHIQMEGAASPSARTGGLI